MPAPASQNRQNISAFTPRKRAILSAPLETKLSCEITSPPLAALEQRQEQRQPLLHEGLAGEVADRLAGEALLGDRKRRRQREVGIFRLLGEFVMLQMVGAVAGEIRADRHRAQPLPDPFVDRLVGVRPPCAASCIRIARPNWRAPTTMTAISQVSGLGHSVTSAIAAAMRAPGVHDQPQAAPRAARRQPAPFLRRKDGLGIDAGHDRHGFPQTRDRHVKR